MDRLKITTTDEHGNTSVSYAIHETVYSLAKDIANLPVNHDELEVLIADKIKRFVHQEKLSVYERILAYFGLERKTQLTEFLEAKIKTHNELATKWKYGTDHSVRPYMVDTIAQIMQDVYHEKIGGWYVAATLDAGGYALSKNSYYKIPKDGSKEIQMEYTAEQQYWWCKCYHKYKTPKHSYYSYAQQYIESYENNQ
jgi:hypothetical protein